MVFVVQTGGLVVLLERDERGFYEGAVRRMRI